MIKECKKHGLTVFSQRNDGRIVCKKCNIEHVSNRRRKLKLKAVEYKGGKCEKCGYDKCIDALEFHHLDPNEKEFGIGSGSTKSWDKLKVEVDKCELVCSNCHKEIHSQVAPMVEQ